MSTDTPALLARWRAAAGGTDAAARSVLGVTKATWSDYVNHKRSVPRYIERSIEAHLALRKADAGAFEGLLGKREREAARQHCAAPAGAGAGGRASATQARSNV